MGLYTVLMVIHSIVVLLLILMILLQRTDSDGMGGLGGGGGNQFLTGRATANLMTHTTAILAAVFMLLSLALAVVASRMTSHSIVDSTVIEESAPAALEKAPAESPAAAPAEQPAEKPKAAPSVPKPE